MNTLELKGGMIEMIAGVNNKELLQHLYEVVGEMITQTANDDLLLTKEQELKLEADIQASYVEENLVDNNVARQKMSRWLKQ